MTIRSCGEGVDQHSDNRSLTPDAGHRVKSVDAPDPILPETSLWPTAAWLSVLLLVLIASVVHAGSRKRWTWLAGMVVLAPVAVVAYWAVELLRPCPPDQRYGQRTPTQ